MFATYDTTQAAALVDLDALRRGTDWGRWRELTHDAPPFLSPEFFALVRPLAEGDDPVLAAAWSDGRMIGALPLIRRGDALYALRSVHSPEYDFHGTPAGLDAIWATLRDDARWTELVFENVRDDSPLATQLPALARASGCPSVTRPGSRHPFFALPGFEARMPAKFHSNLERCARKAGGLVLERILSPSRHDLDEAMAIEAMAWKAAAGTSLDTDPRVAHVYRVLARLWGQRGTASLYFLRGGGVRIATLFAVEDERTLYALKIGYDPRKANVSPGHLMIWKVAADAEQRGKVELDFVGRDDEWKRKWTDRVHQHVNVVIYRRSARGLARYWLREEIKPHVPETWLAGRHGALAHGCQRVDLIGAHTRVERVRARLTAGLGIRRRLRALLSRRPPRPRQGAESKFPVGAWVRVLDEPRLRATLDDRDRLRGLAFVPTQWETCGQVYKVSRHVRRMRDDHGVWRPIARTVLVEGVDCAGHGPEPAGCGRHCPLMFRDEWLEPPPAPQRAPTPADTRRRARVRDADEIEASLDVFGRRDGLRFMPEMRAYAGRRFPIASRLERTFEHDRWIAPPRPIYILDGLHCGGGADGCDRACALLWHEDWLVFEEATP